MFSTPRTSQVATIATSPGAASVTVDSPQREDARMRAGAGSGVGTWQRPLEDESALAPRTTSHAPAGVTSDSDVRATRPGPVLASGRVLVVGDDPIIADSVPASLRFAGYDTHVARTGTQAMQASEHVHPHIVVLDTHLPDVNAYTLARQLRRRCQRTPLLYLTAPTHAHTQGTPLTIGADDYLTKPFSLDELRARVRAALRRAHYAQHPDGAILGFADLRLNEDTQQVHRAGQPVQLTPREREILRYLLVNAGRIVTRAHIHEHVWPYDYTGHARVLDVHICTLRRKIHRHGLPLIHTLHGVGYILRQPDQ